MLLKRDPNRRGYYQEANDTVVINPGGHEVWAYKVCNEIACHIDYDPPDTPKRRRTAARRVREEWNGLLLGVLKKLLDRTGGLGVPSELPN